MTWKTLLVAVMLFCQCGSPGVKHIFIPRDIPRYTDMRWNNDTTVLALSSNMTVALKQVHIKPGKYVIVFKAEGSIAQNTLPYMRIFLGNAYIYDDSIKTGINQYIAKFETKEDITESIQFEFKNDYSSPTEDRNIFLHFPIELKKY